MLTNIKSYLDTVCEQIRFQKAHDIVKKELQSHIIDQTDAFIEQGIEKETAIQKAIAEMGDPVLVGTELDRVHRPKLEWSFILFVVLFFIANIIMRWTVAKASIATGYPVPDIGINNIISIVVSIIVMAAFYYIDFTVLAQHSKMIYAVYVILLAFVYVYSQFFGYVNTAHIIIHIFTYDIITPPLLYLYPVVLTGLLYDCRGKCYSAILLCGASFLLPAFFSFNLRINTALFIIAMISILLMITAICKGWFAVNKVKALLMLLVPIILLIVFLYTVPQFAYQLQKFHIAIIDETGADWSRNILQHNVKEAKLFGTGGAYSFYANDGRLVQMTPENFFQGAEYFVNYALHYFGWIVFALFLAIYIFFIVRGFVLAHRQKSQLGFMTAFAILLTITIIAVWNIACTSGYFININPLELPFFSGGGTVTIIYSILMGILLSVFRTGKYTNDNNVIKQERHFIMYKNGEITFRIPLKK